jgi:4-amino-4-deoxy-L-arabinose transferase-like glycosyltransferase
VHGRWLSWTAWGAIVWTVFFWRLGYASLLDPDEAHYAELTREMLHSGSWLVPLLDGKPFIDKPVLFHWLQGASVVLLGETEFAARLPSALAAIALFALTRWAGAALLGAEVGTLGAIMFATIPATFALSSIALFDMVFACFLFGGLACLLVASTERRERVEVSGYVLLTLAVMTKGPVALVLVGLWVAAGLVFSARMRAQIQRLHWRLGLVCVTLAASPWFVWMQVRFGSDFARGYLLAGNLFYFTQPAEFSTRVVSHTFYMRAFAGAFFPWNALVIGRGIDALRKRVGQLDTSEALLWTWVLVVLGFFSVARFKLDHYIFPAAPACCLIAAKAWRDAAVDEEGKLSATRNAVLVVAGLLVTGGSFASVYLWKLNLELPRVAIVLPLALIAGGIALMFQCARIHWRVPASAGAVVAMLLVSYATVVVVGYPALEEMRPTAQVAAQLGDAMGGEAPVGLYQLERWRGSLRYYLNRPIQRLDTAEQARAFFDRTETVYAIMLRRDYVALRQQHVRVHPMIAHRAVVGTEGKGLRKQRWGYLVVVTNVPRRFKPPWKDEVGQQRNY